MNTHPVILLIINNTELRQLYHEILTTEHWEVLVASNLVDALLHLISKPNQLIIIDSQLKGDETLRLLKIIAKKPQWCKRPLIVLDLELAPQNLSIILETYPTWTTINTHLTSPGELVEKIKELL